MYRDYNGSMLFKNEIVVAPDGQLGWIVDFTKQGNEVWAKLRNGCSYTVWRVEEVVKVNEVYL